VLEKLAGRNWSGATSPREPGRRKTWADIRKAKRLLGYKPVVGLEEGLARTWNGSVETGSSKRQAASWEKRRNYEKVMLVSARRSLLAAR